MHQEVKNRDWVKNAAIIFLVVILVLTFFSNTIMNRSLPEVASQEVTSGSIVARVRGTGTVQANSNTQVKMDRTRVIRSVLVKVGQQVEAGDVLFTLGEGASEEIDAAEEKLQSLQASYNRTAATIPEFSYATDTRKIGILAEKLAEAESAMNNARAKRDASINPDSDKNLKIIQGELDRAVKAREEAERKYNGEIEQLQGWKNKQDSIVPEMVEHELLDGDLIHTTNRYEDRPRIEIQISRVESEASEEKYLIIFENDDGAALYSSRVSLNEVPNYIFGTPTSSKDTSEYTYRFVGWRNSNEKPIAPATEDMTYKAVYDYSTQIPKEKDDGSSIVINTDGITINIDSKQEDGKRGAVPPVDSEEDEEIDQLMGSSSISDYIVEEPVEEPENDPPENDPPENDPPENDPPENDPPENDPPENDPPENDPPENDPPENDPPENDPPENDPPENDPPENDPPVANSNDGVIATNQMMSTNNDLGIESLSLDENMDAESDEAYETKAQEETSPKTDSYVFDLDTQYKESTLYNIHKDWLSHPNDWLKCLNYCLRVYDECENKIFILQTSSVEEYEAALEAEKKWSELYDEYMETITPEGANYKARYEAYRTAKDNYDTAIETYHDKKANNEVTLAGYNADLANIWAQIVRAREKLDELLGGEDAKILAKASGTIKTLSAGPGDTKKKDDIIATIEVPDMGYKMSFSVTNEQANRLRVGDTGTVSNFYWGSEITATLNSIEIDQKNPTTNKLLTFDLSGNVSAGTELTISVGQKSANYDVIVPSSSVRTDANGTYVLKLDSKNSPLGNRYYARRVPVEVLAVDDMNSALNADLSFGDYVITSSSTPLKNGEMVRLATGS